MYMAYLATAVANDFLELAELEKRALTQMHLQKLIYFSHGRNLARHEKPLTIERFEAWDYGPVIRRLWERLSRFGSQPVTEKLSDFMVKGGKFKRVITTIEDSANKGETADEALEIVREVWHKYGRYSAIKLSELTHVSDGPWAVARSRGLPFIPDSDIKAYFKSHSGAL